MRIVRLRPTREFCVLGNIAEKLGWKHAEDVRFFEDKRIAEETKVAVDRTAIDQKNEKVLA